MPLILSGDTGISGVDGTAGTPSLQGTDNNTGVFYATDIVGIATGGSERMRIDSSGNVLVGATAQLNSEKQYIYQSANGIGLQINCVNASQTDYAFRIRAARNTSNGTFNALGYYNDGAGAYKFVVTDGGNISTFGGQITFPATQSASSDANTLDDYEEGTWTPTLTRASTNPTVVYTNQYGTYTKVGRFVYLSGYMSWTTYSGGSGAFRIAGLPFNVLNNAGAYPQLLTTDYEGFDFQAGCTGLGGYGSVNGNTVTFVCYGDNIASAIPAAINNTGYIYFNLMYQV